MATRFYLRNVTAANSPTAGKQSTVLPVNTLGANNATGTKETRSLLTAKGTTQTSIANTGDASTAARDNYLARFSSPALAAQTFGSGTWSLGIGMSEANNNANSFFCLSIYIWRPGTSSVVGYIYDSHAALATEWGASQSGRVFTLTGSNVTAAAGDILVLEVWRVAASQGAATAYAQTLFFEGPTDVIANATSNAASYIEAPVTVNLDAQGSDPVAVNLTEVATASVPPVVTTGSESDRAGLTETGGLRAQLAAREGPS